MKRYTEIVLSLYDQPVVIKAYSPQRTTVTVYEGGASSDVDLDRRHLRRLIKALQRFERRMKQVEE